MDSKLSGTKRRREPSTERPSRDSKGKWKGKEGSGEKKKEWKGKAGGAAGGKPGGYSKSSADASASKKQRPGKKITKDDAKVRRCIQPPNQQKLARQTGQWAAKTAP